MAKMITPKLTKVQVVLSLTEEAYSIDRYTSWEEVAALLLKKGFTVKQAAAIMLSQWARWAADAFAEDGAKADPEALIKFMSTSSKHYGPAGVRKLTKAIFGVEA